jgi:hypothetical protein
MSDTPRRFCPVISTIRYRGTGAGPLGGTDINDVTGWSLIEINSASDPAFMGRGEDPPLLDTATIESSWSRQHLLSSFLLPSTIDRYARLEVLRVFAAETIWHFYCEANFDAFIERFQVGLATTIDLGSWQFLAHVRHIVLHLYPTNIRVPHSFINKLISAQHRFPRLKLVEFRSRRWDALGSQTEAGLPQEHREVIRSLAHQAVQLEQALQVRVVGTGHSSNTEAVTVAGTPRALSDSELLWSKSLEQVLFAMPVPATWGEQEIIYLDDPDHVRYACAVVWILVFEDELQKLREVDSADI